jgi:hypothetical protein
LIQLQVFWLYAPFWFIFHEIFNVIEVQVYLLEAIGPP